MLRVASEKLHLHGNRLVVDVCRPSLWQVKKDKEELEKQWGTTGILGTLQGHARGIQVPGVAGKVYDLRTLRHEPAQGS